MMQLGSSMEDQDVGTVVKRLSVPIGLEELMTGLTKEVLQKKPMDIYSFASDHFAQLLALRDNGNYQQAPSKSIAYASRETVENLLETGKTPKTSNGTPTKLSRQVSIRADSPNKRNGPKIKRSGTPKFESNNNNEGKLHDKQDRKRPVPSKRQTPGSKGKFDNLEPVKEDALKMLSKRQQRSTDRKSKTDSENSKDGKRSSSEEADKKKRQSRDSSLKKKSSEKKVHSGDSKESKDKKNGQEKLKGEKSQSKKKPTEETLDSKNDEKIQKSPSLGLQHSGETHDTLIHAEDKLKSKTRKKAQKSPSLGLQHSGETHDTLIPAEDKLESKTPEHVQKSPKLGLQHSGETHDTLIPEEDKSIDETDGVKIEYPEKMILKSSSVEEGTTGIQDGRLTVTPPKILKSAQMSPEDDQPISLIVPVLGAATTYLNGEKTPEQNGDKSKRGSLKEDSETGEIVSSSKNEDVSSNKYDPSALREELQKVEEESKLNNYTSSYNPYKLKQEIRNASKEHEDEENGSNAQSLGLDGVSISSEGGRTAESAKESHGKEDSHEEEAKESTEQPENNKLRLLHGLTAVSEGSTTGSVEGTSLEHKEMPEEDLLEEKYSTTPAPIESETSSSSGLQHSGELHDQVILKDSDEDKKVPGEINNQKKSPETTPTLLESTSRLQHSGELHDQVIPEESNKDKKSTPDAKSPVDLRSTSGLQHSGELHDHLIPKEVNEDDIKKTSTLDLQHSGELHDTLVIDHVDGDDVHEKDKHSTEGLKSEDEDNQREETSSKLSIGETIAQAASKIQAGVRGYLTRKLYKDKPSSSGATKQDKKKLSDEELQQALTQLDSVPVPSESPHTSRHKREASPIDLMDIKMEDSPAQKDKLLRSKTVQGLEPEKSLITSLFRSVSVTDSALSKTLDEDEDKMHDSSEDSVSLEHTEDLGIGSDKSITIHSDTTMKSAEQEKIPEETSIVSLEHSGELHDRLIPKETETNHDQIAEDVDQRKKIAQEENGKTGQDSEISESVPELKEEELHQLASLSESQHSGEPVRSVSTDGKLSAEISPELQDDITSMKYVPQHSDELNDLLPTKGVEETPQKDKDDKNLEKVVVEGTDKLLEKVPHEIEEDALQHSGELHDVMIPKYGEETLQKDNEVKHLHEAAVEASGKLLADITQELKDDKTLIKDALQHSGELHDILIPKEAQENLHEVEDVKDLAAESIDASGKLADDISQELKDDKTLIKDALQHSGELHDVLIPKEVHETLKDVKNLAAESVEASGKLAEDLSQELKDDKTLIEDSLQHSGELHDVLIPKEVQETVQDVKNLAAEGVEASGKLSDDVSQELQDDKALVKDVLQHSGELHDVLIPKEVQETVQDVKKLATESVEASGKLADDISQELQDDNALVKDALQHSGELHDVLIPKGVQETLQDVKNLAAESVEASGKLSDDIAKELHEDKTLLKDALQHSGELHDVIIPKEATLKLDDEKKEKLEHSGELHDVLLPKEVEETLQIAQDVKKLSMENIEASSKLADDISKEVHEDKTLIKDALQHSGELHDVLIPKEVETQDEKKEEGHLQHTGELHDILVPKEVEETLHNIKDVETLAAESIAASDKLSEEISKELEDDKTLIKDTLQHSGELHDVLIPNEGETIAQDNKKEEHSGELHDSAIPKEGEEILQEVKDVKNLAKESIEASDKPTGEISQELQDDKPLVKDILQHSGELHDVLISKEAENLSQDEKKVEDAEKISEDLQDDKSLIKDILQPSEELQDVLVSKEVVQDGKKKEEPFEHTGELHDVVVPKEVEETIQEVKDVKNLESAVLQKSDDISQESQDDKTLIKDGLEHSGELHDVLIPKEAEKSVLEKGDDTNLQHDDENGKKLVHSEELHDLTIPKETEDTPQRLQDDGETKGNSPDNKNLDDIPVSQKLADHSTELKEKDDSTISPHHTEEIHDALLPKSESEHGVEEHTTDKSTKSALDEKHEDVNKKSADNRTDDTHKHSPSLKDQVDQNGSKDTTNEELISTNGLQHSGEWHDLLIPHMEEASKPQSEDEKVEEEIKVSSVHPTSAKPKIASPVGFQHSGEMHDLVIPQENSSDVDINQEDLTDNSKTVLEDKSHDDPDKEELITVGKVSPSSPPTTASDLQGTVGLQHTGEIHDIVVAEETKDEGKNDDDSKPLALNQVQNVEVAKVECSGNENSLNQPCTPSVLAESSESEGREAITSATPRFDLSHDILTISSKIENKSPQPTDVSTEPSHTELKTDAPVPSNAQVEELLHARTPDVSKPTSKDSAEGLVSRNDYQAEHVKSNTNNKPHQADFEKEQQIKEPQHATVDHNVEETVEKTTESLNDAEEASDQELKSSEPDTKENQQESSSASTESGPSHDIKEIEGQILQEADLDNASAGLHDTFDSYKISAELDADNKTKVKDEKTKTQTRQEGETLKDHEQMQETNEKEETHTVSEITKDQDQMAETKGKEETHEGSEVLKDRDQLEETKENEATHKRSETLKDHDQIEEIKGKEETVLASNDAKVLEEKGKGLSKEGKKDVKVDAKIKDSGEVIENADKSSNNLVEEQIQENDKNNISGKNLHEDDQNSNKSFDLTKLQAEIQKATNDDNEAADKVPVEEKNDSKPFDISKLQTELHEAGKPDYEENVEETDLENDNVPNVVDNELHKVAEIADKEVVPPEEQESGIHEKQYPVPTHCFDVSKKGAGNEIDRDEMNTQMDSLYTTKVIGAAEIKDNAVQENAQEKYLQENQEASGKKPLEGGNASFDISKPHAELEGSEDGANDNQKSPVTHDDFNKGNIIDDGRTDSEKLKLKSKPVQNDEDNIDISSKQKPSDRISKLRTEIKGEEEEEGNNKDVSKTSNEDVDLGVQETVAEKHMKSLNSEPKGTPQEKSEEPNSSTRNQNSVDEKEMNKTFEDISSTGTYKKLEEVGKQNDSEIHNAAVDMTHKIKSADSDQTKRKTLDTVPYVKFGLITPASNEKLNQEDKIKSVSGEDTLEGTRTFDISKVHSELAKEDEENGDEDEKAKGHLEGVQENVSAGGLNTFDISKLRSELAEAGKQPEDNKTEVKRQEDNDEKVLLADDIKKSTKLKSVHDSEGKSLIIDHKNKEEFKEETEREVNEKESLINDGVEESAKQQSAHLQHAHPMDDKKNKESETKDKDEENIEEQTPLNKNAEEIVKLKSVINDKGVLQHSGELHDVLIPKEAALAPKDEEKETLLTKDAEENVKQKSTSHLKSVISDKNNHESKIEHEKEITEEQRPLSEGMEGLAVHAEPFSLTVDDKYEETDEKDKKKEEKKSPLKETTPKSASNSEPITVIVDEKNKKTSHKLNETEEREENIHNKGVEQVLSDEDTKKEHHAVKSPSHESVKSSEQPKSVDNSALIDEKTQKVSQKGAEKEDEDNIPNKGVGELIKPKSAHRTAIRVTRDDKDKRSSEEDSLKGGQELKSPDNDDADSEKLKSVDNSELFDEKNKKESKKDTEKEDEEIIPNKGVEGLIKPKSAHLTEAMGATRDDKNKRSSDEDAVQEAQELKSPDNDDADSAKPKSIDNSELIDEKNKKESKKDAEKEDEENIQNKGVEGLIKPKSAHLTEAMGATRDDKNKRSSDEDAVQEAQELKSPDNDDADSAKPKSIDNSELIDEKNKKESKKDAEKEDEENIPNKGVEGLIKPKSAHRTEAMGTTRGDKDKRSSDEDAVQEAQQLQSPDNDDSDSAKPKSTDNSELIDEKNKKEFKEDTKKEDEENIPNKGVEELIKPKSAHRTEAVRATRDDKVKQSSEKESAKGGQKLKSSDNADADPKKPKSVDNSVPIDKKNKKLSKEDTKKEDNVTNEDEKSLKPKSAHRAEAITIISHDKDKQRSKEEGTKEGHDVKSPVNDDTDSKKPKSVDHSEPTAINDKKNKKPSKKDTEKEDNEENFANKAAEVLIKPKSAHRPEAITVSGDDKDKQPSEEGSKKEDNEIESNEAIKESGKPISADHSKASAVVIDEKSEKASTEDTGKEDNEENISNKGEESLQPKSAHSESIIAINDEKTKKLSKADAETEDNEENILNKATEESIKPKSAHRAEAQIVIGGDKDKQPSEEGTKMEDNEIKSNQAMKESGKPKSADHSKASAVVIDEKSEKASTEDTGKEDNEENISNKGEESLKPKSAHSKSITAINDEKTKKLSKADAETEDNEENILNKATEDSIKPKSAHRAEAAIVIGDDKDKQPSEEGTKMEDNEIKSNEAMKESGKPKSADHSKASAVVIDEKSEKASTEDTGKEDNEENITNKGEESLKPKSAHSESIIAINDEKTKKISKADAEKEDNEENILNKATEESIKPKSAHRAEAAIVIGDDKDKQPSEGTKMEDNEIKSNETMKESGKPKSADHSKASAVVIDEKSEKASTEDTGKEDNEENISNKVEESLKPKSAHSESIIAINDEKTKKISKADAEKEDNEEKILNKATEESIKPKSAHRTEAAIVIGDDKDKQPSEEGTKMEDNEIKSNEAMKESGKPKSADHSKVSTVVIDEKSEKASTEDTGKEDNEENITNKGEESLKPKSAHSESIIAINNEKTKKISKADAEKVDNEENILNKATEESIKPKSAHRAEAAIVIGDDKDKKLSEEDTTKDDNEIISNEDIKMSGKPKSAYHSKASAVVIDDKSEEATTVDTEKEYNEENISNTGEKSRTSRSAHRGEARTVSGDDKDKQQSEEDTKKEGRNENSPINDHVNSDKPKSAHSESIIAMNDEKNKKLSKEDTEKEDNEESILDTATEESLKPKFAHSPEAITVTSDNKEKQPSEEDSKTEGEKLESNEGVTESEKAKSADHLKATTVVIDQKNEKSSKKEAEKEHMEEKIPNINEEIPTAKSARLAEAIVAIDDDKNNEASEGDATKKSHEVKPTSNEGVEKPEKLKSAEHSRDAIEDKTKQVSKADTKTEDKEDILTSPEVVGKSGDKEVEESSEKSPLKESVEESPKSKSAGHSKSINLIADEKDQLGFKGDGEKEDNTEEVRIITGVKESAKLISENEPKILSKDDNKKLESTKDNAINPQNIPSDENNQVINIPMSNFEPTLSSNNVVTPKQSTDQNLLNSLQDESSMKVYETAPTRLVTSDITPNINPNENIQIPSENLHKQVQDTEQIINPNIKSVESLAPKVEIFNNDPIIEPKEIGKVESAITGNNEESVKKEPSSSDALQIKVEEDGERPVSITSTTSTDSLSTIIAVSPRDQSKERKHSLSRSLSNSSEKSEESKTDTIIDATTLKHENEAKKEIGQKDIEVKEEESKGKNFDTSDSKAEIDEAANEEKPESLRNVPNVSNVSEIGHAEKEEHDKNIKETKHLLNSAGKESPYIEQLGSEAEEQAVRDSTKDLTAQESPKSTRDGAATTIQSNYRGYRVRRHLGNGNLNVAQEELEAPDKEQKEKQLRVDSADINEHIKATLLQDFSNEDTHGILPNVSSTPDGSLQSLTTDTEDRKHHEDHNVKEESESDITPALADSSLNFQKPEEKDEKKSEMDHKTKDDILSDEEPKNKIAVDVFPLSPKSEIVKNQEETHPDKLSSNPEDVDLSSNKDLIHNKITGRTSSEKYSPKTRPGSVESETSKDPTIVDVSSRFGGQPTITDQNSVDLQNAAESGKTSPKIIMDLKDLKVNQDVKMKETSPKSPKSPIAAPGKQSTSVDVKETMVEKQLEEEEDHPISSTKEEKEQKKQTPTGSSLSDIKDKKSKGTEAHISQTEEDKVDITPEVIATAPPVHLLDPEDEYDIWTADDSFYVDIGSSADPYKHATAPPITLLEDHTDHQMPAHRLRDHLVGSSSDKELQNSDSETTAVVEPIKSVVATEKGSPRVNKIEETIQKASPSKSPDVTQISEDSPTNALRNLASPESSESTDSETKKIKPVVPAGAIPKALDVILDQQLGITAPNAEGKQEATGAKHPDSIHTPLQEPKEESASSSLDHTEIHDATAIPPLHLMQENVTGQKGTSDSTDKESNSEDEIKPCAPEEDFSNPKYDLVDPGVSPRLHIEADGTVSKALGVVLDQQLAITAPKAEDKQKSSKTEAPQYIHIPLKGPMDDITPVETPVASSCGLQHSGEFHDTISMLNSNQEEETHMGEVKSKHVISSLGLQHAGADKEYTNMGGVKSEHGTEAEIHHVEAVKGGIYPRIPKEEDGEDKIISCVPEEDFSNPKYDYVEGVASPRVHIEADGAVPKALGNILEQQLAITAPRGEEKREGAKSESPDYIYIPLKDSEEPSVGLQHSGELHDSIVMPLSAEDKKAKKSGEPVHEKKVATVDEDTWNSSKYDLVEGAVKPKIRKEQEGTVPKVLGTVVDQQLAITAPLGKPKEEKHKSVGPQYIHIPLKNSSGEESLQNEIQVDDPSQHSSSQEKGLTNGFEGRNSDKPSEEKVLIHRSNVSASKEKEVVDRVQDKDKIPSSQELAKKTYVNGKLEEKELGLKDKNKPLAAQGKNLAEGLQNEHFDTALKLQKNVVQGEEQSQEKEASNTSLISKVVTTNGHHLINGFKEKEGNEMELQDHEEINKAVTVSQLKTEAPKPKKHGPIAVEELSIPKIEEPLSAKLSPTILASNKSESSPTLSPVHPFQDHINNSVESTLSMLTPSTSSLSLDQPPQNVGTPTLGLHLRFSPSPTQSVDGRSQSNSPNSGTDTSRSRDSLNSTREDRSVQSESSPIVIHSTHISDNTMPLAVQLNQAPGAAVLTSPTPNDDDNDAGETLAAHASGKGVSTKVEARKNRAHFQTSMETGKRKNASIIKEKNMEEDAATKIQASFRGYQVRKQLKLKNGGVDSIRRSLRRKSSGKLRGSDKISQKTSGKPSALEEKSATKIQAGIRGFLVRRRQQKKPKNNTTPESS